MTNQGMTLIQFDLDFIDFEQNRMYPPGYRRESPMTELERYIKDLREIADRDVPTVITLPPNMVGLPEGSYIPKALFNYIADALEGKIT